jgi:hypothetical protein
MVIQVAGFIIQRGNDGLPILDLGYTVIDLIKQQNWLYNKTIHEYGLFSDVQHKICQVDIPVGNIEFVLQYLKHWHNIEVKPINIPEVLMNKECLKRIVLIEQLEEYSKFNRPMFIKQNNVFKGIIGVIDPSVEIKHYQAKAGEYLVSEVIPIIAEYRCFIYNNELVGCKNYAGDFRVLPDFDLISYMIRIYEDSPIAYCMDVGINQSGTFLIEVHHFFSCGLYGFDDNIILKMHIRAFNEIIDRNRQ